MKITVLGKYGPFAPNGFATSGYLLRSNDLNVLIDAGAGTSSRLLSLINAKDLSFIILSHLHFDHISDLGVLSYALDFSGRTDKVKVYLPKCDLIQYEMLSKIGAYELVPISEGVTYCENGIKFSFYKMVHPVTSYGVKIESNGKTFAYTGDTTYNDNLLNLVKGASLVVADGAFLEKDFLIAKPHMSVKQATSLTELIDGKVIISHIGYKYSDSDVLQEIKAVSDRATIAVEGETYLV